MITNSCRCQKILKQKPEAPKNKLYYQSKKSIKKQYKNIIKTQNSYTSNVINYIFSRLGHVEFSQQ